MNKPEVPFFVRFLEQQELPVQTDVKAGGGGPFGGGGGRPPIVTMKYPSDDDEGGVSI